MHASRIERTSSSTAAGALPIRLTRRARKSIDLSCSAMMNPVTGDSPPTGTWKREAAVGVRHRADEGQARALVEKRIAHDQGGPPAPLLVARLGIEADDHQIAFLGHVAASSTRPPCRPPRPNPLLLAL